jgi:hypothetical protein
MISPGCTDFLAQDSEMISPTIPILISPGAGGVLAVWFLASRDVEGLHTALGQLVRQGKTFRRVLWYTHGHHGRISFGKIGLVFRNFKRRCDLSAVARVQKLPNDKECRSHGNMVSVIITQPQCASVSAVSLSSKYGRAEWIEKLKP